MPSGERSDSNQKAQEQIFHQITRRATAMMMEQQDARHQWYPYKPIVLVKYKTNGLHESSIPYVKHRAALLASQESDKRFAKLMKDSERLASVYMNVVEQHVTNDDIEEDPSLDSHIDTIDYGLTNRTNVAIRQRRAIEAVLPFIESMSERERVLKEANDELLHVATIARLFNTDVADKLERECVKVIAQHVDIDVASSTTTNQQVHEPTPREELKKELAAARNHIAELEAGGSKASMRKRKNKENHMSPKKKAKAGAVPVSPMSLKAQETSGTEDKSEEGTKVVVYKKVGYSPLEKHAVEAGDVHKDSPSVDEGAIESDDEAFAQLSGAEAEESEEETGFVLNKETSPSVEDVFKATHSFLDVNDSTSLRMSSKILKSRLEASDETFQNPVRIIHQERLPTKVGMEYLSQNKTHCVAQVQKF